MSCCGRCATSARSSTRSRSSRPRFSVSYTWTPRSPCRSPQGGQLLDELPPAAIDAIVEAAGPGSGSPLLSLELRQLGGALNDAPPDAGALATLDHGVPYASASA